jgi:hypothetical protein
MLSLVEAFIEFFSRICIDLLSTGIVLRHLIFATFSPLAVVCRSPPTVYAACYTHSDSRRQECLRSFTHSTTNLLTISYIAWIAAVSRSTGMRSSTPCTKPSLLGVLRWGRKPRQGIPLARKK